MLDLAANPLAEMALEDWGRPATLAAVHYERLFKDGLAWKWHRPKGDPVRETRR